MTGFEATAAFLKADALVKLGKYDEARAVELYPSDRAAIEARISRAMASGAKTTNEL